MCHLNSLDRFLKAHEFLYDKAVTELKNGKKTSHWMWVVFPQLVDLGKSVPAKRYGIEDSDEASEYLSHAVLGKRLVECCEILLTQKTAKPEITAIDIFGEVDAKKLQSCMTLFTFVANDFSVAGSIFQQVIDTYFAGLKDKVTLDLL